jgi:RNA recognition motif-containing protein
LSKLFVGNLDFAATRQSLEGLFAPHGEIVDLALPIDRESGRPRGFAFVTFGDDASATRAMQQLDGTDFLGRSLRVSVATPRPERRAPGAPPPSRPERGSPRSAPSPSAFVDVPEDFGSFTRAKGSRRGLRARKRSL